MAALDTLKYRYYQYAADCQLFGRVPERVGQWFVNRYVMSGIVYTIGTGVPLFYAEDAALCWRTISQWLRDYSYHHTAPAQVREVDNVGISNSTHSYTRPHC